MQFWASLCHVSEHLKLSLLDPTAMVEVPSWRIPTLSCTLSSARSLLASLVFGILWYLVASDLSTCGYLISLL